MGEELEDKITKPSWMKKPSDICLRCFERLGTDIHTCYDLDEPNG